MQAANEALANIFSTSASNINHKVDLIQSVISQPQIQQFLSEFSIQTPNPELFVESLCHSSFVNEYRHLGMRSNERLELLGDAVLDLYITNRLFDLYPDHEEGVLSRLRGALVNEAKLHKVANLIDLSQLILTGKGESRKKGYRGAAIMSDAFEALIGALYRMNGLDGATEFLNQVFAKWESENSQSFFDEGVLHLFDAKSRLQELTMAHFKQLPVYESEETEDGFIVRCLLKGKVIATTQGPSKKKAQRELAQHIIQNNLLDILEE